MENKIENDQGLNDDNKRMSTYVNGKKQDGKKEKTWHRESCLPWICHVTGGTIKGREPIRGQAGHLNWALIMMIIMFYTPGWPLPGIEIWKKNSICAAEAVPDLRVLSLSSLRWRSSSLLFVYALIAQWWRNRFIVLHGLSSSLWRLSGSRQD